MNSKVKFDFNSIRVKLWLYFAGITIGILALIWILQVFLLNNSYEQMKIKEVERVSYQISHAFERGDESLPATINQLSSTNDIYVMMEAKDAILFFGSEDESLLPVYKYKAESAGLKKMLTKSKNPNVAVSYRFSSATDKYNTLAYARIINDPSGGNVFLYIFSPLYPVSSTISILTNQLTMVTIIAIVIAFILAYYFSTRISKPIKKITANAKKMGQGDYDVVFETASYSEVSNLARTLNNAAYELGRADNLQKDLIANVSHDLKTPLTMIKSYSEMIRDLSGDIPEKRNAHLNVIMEEADRMAKLVSDMSTIAQMQNAKIELNNANFDLREIADSQLQTYNILEETEGYKFNLIAPKECAVYGDKDRIKQVIANLTGNAIKYCGDNKEISIIIKKIGRFYRLEVIDHGPGIKKEDLIHIWDRYYRVSDNYTRNQSGTGLGLSIVKQILTLHNSEFGVESEVGVGSTFWFELEQAKK